MSSNKKEAMARRSSAAVMHDTVSATPEQVRRHELFSHVRFVVVLVLLIIIILSVLDVLPIMDTVGDSLVDNIRDMGVGGGFLYAILCSLFVIVCVPASLLSLAGGYIWENTVWGFLAAYPGVMMGAALSFFLGRILFKDFLETELRGNLKFAALSQAAEENGYKVVFFARLSPIPTGLLNYAFSISAISFKQFFLATGLGLIPIVVLYAKAGSDFFTYFETTEVQEAIDACSALVSECCTKATDTPNQITAIDFAAAGVCPFNTLREIEEDSCIVGASLEFKEIVASCLNADLDVCSFKKIDEEASDLMSCKYNDQADTCDGTKVDNNNCLRSLNEDEMWPKIVLPVALVITLAIVGYFGKRGLDRAGLLQVSYNLDRQRELLMAERELLASEQA